MRSAYLLTALLAVMLIAVLILAVKLHRLTLRASPDALRTASRLTPDTTLTDAPSKEQMAYLNVNSTRADLHAHFNPSDKGYSRVRTSQAIADKLKRDILTYVNAPANAKLLITSGATEGIATMMHWAKRLNPYNACVGTRFDHSSIKKNAEAHKLRYEQVSKQADLLVKPTPSIIVLTHVNSATGEVLDQSLIQAACKYHPESLIFLDATQSITKVPIDMERWGINGLVFSAHKLGGPLGLGVLIVSPMKDKPFIPLIAGEQQDGLRGGTYDLNGFNAFGTYFRQAAGLSERAGKKGKHLKGGASPGKRGLTPDQYQQLVSLFSERDIEVVSPQGQHLHNTILLKVKVCPLAIINSLAERHIYIGTVRACESEKPEEEISGEVRISWSADEPLTTELAKEIAEVILEVEKESGARE